MKIRKNDVVKIMTGEEKGKTGKVLSVDRDAGRILVEGVNYIWKHLRRSQQHPQGARIQKESPLDVSKVQVLCQSCSKPTRVQIKRLDDGGRSRLCRKCRQSVTPED